jgi:rfaE bifunctional protein nucleotidyltransferase chain/domain
MKNSKLFEKDELLRMVQTKHFFNKRVIFTNGCFDVIHAGHIQYLQKAKTLGDFLIVGLNSDASVRKLKGPSRPIHYEMDRAMVLSALSCIDALILFEEDTPLELINLIQPNILVKGGDYTLDKIVGAKETLARGGKVEVIPFLEGHSSTSIIEKLK